MRSTLLILAVLSLSACAGVSAGGAKPRAHGSSRLIAAAEVEESAAPTAYDLIQQLRPRWLYIASGPTTFGRERGTVVYVNDMRMGGLSSLRDVDTNSMHEVAFMDANEATARFGLNHPHGAISISLKVGAPWRRPSEPSPGP